MLELKLGQDLRLAMTKRKGKSFNPYSRSWQDMYIQHKQTSFRKETVHTGLMTSSSTVVKAMMINEGEVVTGVVELKKSTFDDDQTLGEMLCCLTNCTVEQLKNGNQVKKAIAYGLVTQRRQNYCWAVYWFHGYTVTTVVFAGYR